MAFWLVIGVLTVAASLSVIVPLSSRRRKGAFASTAHDIEVYRDQLAEVSRDADRGLIAAGEAEEARAEIGRRILRLAEHEAGGTDAPIRTRPARALAAAMVLAVPLLSWGLYAVLGSPELPGQPLAERLARNPGDSSVDELVARAEAHLRANPSDGRGWDVLAPIYLRLDRAEDSVTAYRNAIRLLGPSTTRESGLGEALAAASGGVVTEEAAAALRRALALDGSDPKAQYLLATAMAQEGKTQEARSALETMLAGLPAESPWRQMVMRALEGPSEGEQAARPGPSQDDVESAQAMSPADRSEMIEGMVARLDQRLRDNPADLVGWRRLIQSYTVLKRPDDARDALARGVAALGSATDAGRDLIAYAASVGVERSQP